MRQSALINSAEVIGRIDNNALLLGITIVLSVHCTWIEAKRISIFLWISPPHTQPLSLLHQSVCIFLWVCMCVSYCNLSYRSILGTILNSFGCFDFSRRAFMKVGCHDDCNCFSPSQPMRFLLTSSQFQYDSIAHLRNWTRIMIYSIDWFIANGKRICRSIYLGSR